MAKSKGVSVGRRNFLKGAMGGGTFERIDSALQSGGLTSPGGESSSPAVNAEGTIANAETTTKSQGPSADSQNLEEGKGDDTFQQIDDALRSGGPEALFDLLALRFREEKKYGQLLEARLMKTRWELGLPLVRSELLADLPEDARRAYEEGLTQAAREVGALYLADGDVERAWPYFRAAGETAPVAQAIESVEAKEGIDRIIEIAYFERVNPRKGFELILAQFGLCRAITVFPQYPQREGREECLRLLVRTLHDDLVRNLKRAITSQEGQEPDTQKVPELIRGRDWLFDGSNYYVDTTHLVSVLQYSIESTDPETLAMALEFTEYGSRLSPLFQYKGTPPFENVYPDHAFYLRALLGDDPEASLAHLREKLTAGDSGMDGNVAAQALVRLLVRLGRYSEAIDVSAQYLGDADPSQLACPTLFHLCQLAGDYKRLMELARERGDLLNYTAGALQPVPTRTGETRES